MVVVCMHPMCSHLQSLVLGNPLLAAGIHLAEDDVADMFEYMGQAVGADILDQRGRRVESYKAFKRLHWKLKVPQGNSSHIETACLVVLETFNCSVNWLPIPTTAISIYNVKHNRRCILGSRDNQLSCFMLKHKHKLQTVNAAVAHA